ncbi:MAG: hypothetical protein K0R71_832 [Bacillales bacterium]|jgi:hypothetical protein|nr:hypothetical protein [Bacillales bacterium]
MDWIYIIIFVVVIVSLLLIFSKIKFQIQYSREADTNHFKINIKALYGLVHFQKKSELKLKPEGMAIGIKNQNAEQLNAETASKSIKSNFTLIEFYNKMKDFIRVIERTENLIGILFGFTRKIKINKFLLKLKIGDGDAAEAAQKVGVAWSIVGAELAFIQTVFNVVDYPEIDIIPIFHQKTFSMDFNCISEFRVGQLMWAGLKFIFRWKGKRKFLFVPTINEEAVN